MVCSKPFTFPYWFSHLRTRQKQLSLAPRISVYSRRGIVNGKVLKWPETCQIMSWSWLSAWNWVVFFHMLWHWSRQLYYRTKLYERKETGRAEMFFIWFVTSWTHTFIMASAITITYQRTNTLKYFIIQMGPLLSLHLLLTVIGTMLFHLSHLCHYSSNKRPVALLPTAILTFFPLQSPCRKDPSPLVCPVLNMWCCLQRLMRCRNEGLGQGGHGCPYAVPREHWHSWLQAEVGPELHLSSSGYSAWAGFFWNSMYVRWIWT